MTSMTIRICIGVLAALALSACATFNESQCRSGDWRDIGLRDGERGLGPERLSEHTQACAAFGVRPAQSDYEAGRQAGLTRYCTPQSAYQHGAVGNAYLGVCPKASETEFAAALARGRLVRADTPAVYPFYASMDQDERALAAAASDAERARIRGRLTETQWWIAHLLNRAGTFYLD